MALTPLSTTSKARVWAAVGIAVAALLAVAIVITAIMTRRMAGVTPALAVSVLTPPEIAIVGAPALSPNGRAVAFAATDANGHRRIWLRSFAGLDARALPGTEQGEQPFWSPDSESLGFFARGKLATVNVKSGAAPHELTDVAEPRGGSWSREGIIVFSSAPEGALYRISASGGPALPLTSPERNGQDRSYFWPRFLPDGRVILCVKRMDQAGTTSSVITAISVDAASVKTIVNADSTGLYSSGRLLFSRTGKIFAQSFDTIELNLSGEPSVVADNAWSDGSSLPGLVGFDAVEGVFALRPAANDLGHATASTQRESVLHIRFNWAAIRPNEVQP